MSMNQTQKRPPERVTKQINPSINASLFNIFVSVANNFKVVKGHCLKVAGYRMQIDTYWLLLLIGSVGSVRSIALHTLYCYSMSTIALRNTQRRLSALVACGLVDCSKRDVNSPFYSLSFHAEKLIFSGIDKSSLLELSAMVKEIQDEDKAKLKASKVAKVKRSAKVAK